jgi:hypothetical protein
VIRVRAGIYNESYIQVKSGLTIISEDGLYAAKVNADTSTTFRVEGSSTTNRVSNVEIRGFECYATLNTGAWRDGLVRVYNATNVRIKDMKIHDAPHDADVVKIGGSGGITDNVLFENCVIYNPAPRSGDMTGNSGWQENVDIFPANNVTFRGCWIYHTPEVRGNTLIYAKGGSNGILWENNVFGPVYNIGYNDPSVSVGAPSPYNYPSCEKAIVRNNLLLSCGGYGALAMVSSRNVEFYNNLIWNYSGPGGAILFYYIQSTLPRNDNLKCFNNMIVSTNGRPAYFDRNGVNTPTNFTHDYNLYYGISGGGAVNLGAEAHSLVNVDPMLSAPAAPVLGSDTWASLVARFRPAFNSPAIDAGVHLGALVPADVLAVTRPIGTAYDIGACEVLPGDTNADGHVDVVDLLDLVAAFGSLAGDANYDATCDFNTDGAVDVVDLLDLVYNFGQY